MTTVLVNPFLILSKRIRFHFWPVIALIILLGLLFLGSAYRETVLTCQRRGVDLCTLSRLGWQAGNPRSFPARDLTGAQPTSSAAGNSDNISYKLTLITRERSFDLNMTGMRSDRTLIPESDLINHFVQDTSVPELDVRLLDLRPVNLVYGILFSALGLFYLAAMTEVQILLRDNLTGEFSFKSRALLKRAAKETSAKKPPAGQQVSIPKKGWHMAGWRAWLCWVVLPVIGLLSLTFLLQVIGPKIDSSTFIYSALLTMAFGALFGMLFGVQAWVIQRSIGEGLRWLLYSVGGAALLLLLFASVFWLASRMRYWAEVFWIGLLLSGLLHGFFQWLVLRRRLPYASWWLIACAFGPWIYTTAAPAAIKLIGIAGLNQYLPAIFFGLIGDIFHWLGAFAYFAVPATVLVYLIHVKNKQAQTSRT